MGTKFLGKREACGPGREGWRGGHWAGCTDLVATRKGAFLAFGGQMGTWW